MSQESNTELQSLHSQRTDALSALLDRSESRSSCPGPAESHHDGDGLHLYRHVAQQRGGLLPQTGLLLFHPIR